MIRFNPFLLVIALFAHVAHAQQTDIAIVGARIEIGDGRVIANGNIVIRGGKIVAVGESVSTPPNATVISGKGLTVYPGFVDAYSTNGLNLPTAPTAERPPDSRNTAPASMWHANRRGIRSDILTSKCLDLKNRLKDNFSQGVTTALLSPGSGTISGIATLVDYTATGNVLVPSAAAELGFRGGGSAGYPGTLFGITALLRQVLADAVYYVGQSNPKKDDCLENLRPLVNKQMPALFDVDTAREIVRASRVADEFGFKFIVNGGHEAYRVVDLLKANAIPVIVSIDVSSEPSLKPDPGIDSTPVAVLEERHQVWVEHSQNIVKLTSAGIPVAFSGNGSSIDDYLKDVRKQIGFGLPRDVALKSMTSQPAAILGVGDKLGTIEVGKLANLVLMNGDFADAKAQVQSVIVEGVKTDVAKVVAK